MAANATTEDLVHFWKTSYAYKYDGALLSGAFLTILASTALFLVIMSTAATRRHIIFWLQLLGIAVAIVAVVGLLELDRIIVVNTVGQLTAGVPAGNPGPSTARWLMTFNIGSSVSLWITDLVLPLKVLGFYPKALWPSQAKRWGIVAVPLFILVGRIALIVTKGQCTRDAVRSADFHAPLCDISGIVDVCCQIVGNGICTALIIVNTYRLRRRHDGRNAGAHLAGARGGRNNGGRGRGGGAGVVANLDKRFRLLIEATFISFAPAVVCQCVVLVMSIVDLHIWERYVGKSLDDMLYYKRYQQALTDMSLVDVVFTCVFAALATTYAPTRLAYEAASVRDGPGSEPYTPTDRKGEHLDHQPQHHHHLRRAASSSPATSSIVQDLEIVQDDHLLDGGGIAPGHGANSPHFRTSYKTRPCSCTCQQQEQREQLQQDDDASGSIHLSELTLSRYSQSTISPAADGFKFGSGTGAQGI